MFLRFNEMLLKQVCRNDWNVQKQLKFFFILKRYTWLYIAAEYDNKSVF